MNLPRTDLTARTYLGSWAGPSLDRRRNSQELPSLCIHSSSAVTGLFPEKRGTADGAVGCGSAVCRRRDREHRLVSPP